MDPIELERESLYLLGGTDLIQSNYSWRDPYYNGAYESFNSYLYSIDGNCLMIDTGVPIHRNEIEKQLADLLSTSGEPLQGIVGTRLEPDCLSNLPAWTTSLAARGANIYAPGGLNPLDFFDDLNTHALMNQYGLNVVLLRPEMEISVPGTEYGLEVIIPSFRLLTTAWLYDPRSQTLFSSDCCSHLASGSGEGPRVATEDRATDTVGWDFVARHHYTKFDWVTRARVDRIVNEIQQLRSSRTISRIAPSRGCVIEGKNLVDACFDQLIDFLRSPPAPQAA